MISTELLTAHDCSKYINSVENVQINSLLLVIWSRAFSSLKQRIFKEIELKKCVDLFLAKVEPNYKKKIIFV